MSRKGPCPKCKSRDIASILWGYPHMSPELELALKMGTVVLGGCCITGSDPQWHCNACGHEWSSWDLIKDIHLPEDGKISNTVRAECECGFDSGPFKQYRNLATTQRSYYRMQQGVAGKQLKDAWKDGPIIAAQDPRY
jgi:hypothetical protein